VSPSRPLITANSVTVLRLVLIPLPAYLLYTGQTGRWVAVVLGTFLALTDVVDGYLARRQGPTVLGALLDPIADKVFLAATYCPLADLGMIPAWAVALIFIRELGITALRSVFERRHLRLETSYIAKVKTWIQMIGLGLLMFLGVLRHEQAPLLVMGILIAIGLSATVPLLVRRSKHVAIAIVLTSWVIAVAGAEALSGRSAAVMVVVVVILAATWWSGLEYVVAGVRQLRGTAGFDAGDAVRLAGSLIPIPALIVLAGSRAPMWPIALLMAIEFAHGGLDNLLSHHKADLPAVTWGARVGVIGVALVVAVVRPAVATPALLVALVVSAIGAALAFWRRRAVYLSDKALDEPIR
jgi:CDP-diacylglycerol--glycerol-3-phosphate 3-phosphatidyltransferase